MAVQESVLFDVQVLSASTQQFSTARQLRKIRTGANTDSVSTANFGLGAALAKSWQGAFKAIALESKGGGVTLTLVQNSITTTLKVKGMFCATMEFDSLTITNESTNTDVLISLILA